MLIGIPSLLALGSAPPPAAVYILNQDFEGAGVPSGWSAFGSPAADFDYSAAPLAGAQSLRIVVANSSYAVWGGDATDRDEVWGHFMFKTESALPASGTQFFQARDLAFNDAFKLDLNSTGTVSPDGTSTNTVATMSAGTAYHVWFHYIKNTVSEIWFHTSSTRPASGSNNHATGVSPYHFPDASVGSLLFYFSGANTANVYDSVQMAVTDVF